MSTPAVSNVNTNKNISYTISEKKAEASVFTQANAASVVHAEPETDIKAKRQNYVNDFINDYNISLLSYKKILKEAFNIELEDFYALSEEEFENKYRLIVLKFDILASQLRENSNTNENDIVNKVIEDILKDKDNGLNNKQSLNITDKYEDKDLFEILKESSPALKKFNSLNDINKPEDIKILQDAIKNFIKSNENGSGRNDIGKAINLYLYLLSRTEDDKAYTILYNASKDIIKGSDQFKILTSTIRKFSNPKELDKLLNNENIKFIVAKSGLTPEEIQDIVSEVNQALNNDETLKKSVFERIVVVNKTLLDAMQQAEKTPENERTDEQNKLLAAKQNISAGLSSVAIFGDDDNKKAAIDVASKYNITEEVFSLAYNYSQKHPELNVKEVLDKITDGEYSKTIEARLANDDVKDNNGIGISQKVSAEVYNKSEANLPILKSQIKEEKPQKIVVESNAKNLQEQKTNIVKSQAIKNCDAFNNAIAQGLIKIDDAGKDFGNACKSVQQKVLSYLQVQKNNRLDIINKWHNSKLADVAANKFHFNKEQIKKLKLSIGKKQVMENQYEMIHKNEENFA